MAGEQRDAGTYTATASSLSNSNYALPTNKTTLFTINKAELTLNLVVNNQMAPYTGEPINATNSYEKKALLDGQALEHEITIEGTAVYTYSSSSYPASTNPPTNAGSYTIALSGLTISSNNYIVNVIYTDGTLTIVPQEIGITWDNTTFTYDGTAHIPNATATNLVSGDTCTITVTGGQTNAGTYTATAASLSNSNYSLPTNKTVSFTINKADISPTAYVDDYEYGETVSPTITGNSGNGNVIYYYSTENTTTGGTVWTTSTAINAGFYYMYAIIEETTNYNGATTSTTSFYVLTVSLSVPTADTTAFIYNGKTQTYMPIGFDSSTMNITGNMAINAGTQNVIVSLKDPINYYWETPESEYGDKIFSFIITPKEITVSFTGYEGLIYTGNKQNITISLNGIIDGDTCEYTVIGNEGTNAGTYTCEAVSYTHLTLPTT